MMFMQVRIIGFLFCQRTLNQTGSSLLKFSLRRFELKLFRDNLLVLKALNLEGELLIRTNLFGPKNGRE